ncbi:hypothetical protein Taro_044428 [Colocasia esculenta]|uniref:Uncharacterized protein n=1 Tax=Colocasia esculenta TaxID=4460 RepID=A0A843WLX3_COLES|nr:hypothetical protein [Colocasia esculenta]
MASNDWPTLEFLLFKMIFKCTPSDSVRGPHDWNHPLDVELSLSFKEVGICLFPKGNPIEAGGSKSGILFTQICHSGVDTVPFGVDTSSLSQKHVLKSCDPSFQEKVQGSEGQSLERALKFRAREQI